MPVIVKDCSWEQTAEEITVSVPLKGKTPDAAAIFTSDLYLKVHAVAARFFLVLSDRLLLLLLLLFRG